MSCSQEHLPAESKDPATSGVHQQRLTPRCTNPGGWCRASQVLRKDAAAGHSIRRHRKCAALLRVESNEPLAFGNRPASLPVPGWTGQGVRRLASARTLARTTAREHAQQSVESDRNTRLALCGHQLMKRSEAVSPRFGEPILSWAGDRVRGVSTRHTIESRNSDVQFVGHRGAQKARP